MKNSQSLCVAALVTLVLTILNYLIRTSEAQTYAFTNMCARIEVCIGIVTAAIFLSAGLILQELERRR